MTTRVRTINFLPEIFQTKTNTEFLSATLDQLVNPPVTKKIQGYIGSKFGYGVDASDYYIPEITEARTNYQLDPGVVFTKENNSRANDFISYPGITDALSIEGAITTDNNRMFESEIYSWDPFVDLDKVINYNQYYWLQNGAPVVTVSSAIVYTTNDYVVTDLPTVYNIRELEAQSGSSNPTITLLRGGTYRFYVNQPSQFWIQTDPGTSGFKQSQPNIPTREVFGVTNNGATQGIVEFTVPAENAQDQFNFPGDNEVDLISTLPFSQINGKRLSEIGNIDGITSLENLTMMFYNDIPNEVGYVSTYYDEEGFDAIFSPLVSVSLTVGEITSNVLTLSNGSTSSLEVDQSILFNSGVFGGLQQDVIYYVKSIISDTEFTITDAIGNPVLTLSDGTGNMIAFTNPSQYESGFDTTVAENFYQITYVGDSNDPTIRLIPVEKIPINENITVTFGTQWINRDFYRTTQGIITLIPIITAPLTQLYYQDGTTSSKVGVIRIIESNNTNTINVEQDILGKKSYTSTNGVTFTNGLKVEFDGDVIPERYKTGEYYVEGVGNSIELVPVETLVVPESYGTVDKDYITISRNSISNNQWSRSNRWFHVNVIKQTAAYNDNPSIITEFAVSGNKANRPILEFYPNLKLFNSGIIGKEPVDFIDQREVDAFSNIVGLERYYPDVETYTTPTATVASASGTSTTITVPTDAIIGKFIIGQYISDYLNVLPDNTRITDMALINGGNDTELTVTWQESTSVGSANNIVVVATSDLISKYQLVSGSRIIFAKDADDDVRDKIYTVNFAQVDEFSSPVISLTEALDGQCVDNDQTVVLSGYNDKGNSYYFIDGEWKPTQQKNTVNQAPLFDVFDDNGTSFSDEDSYTSSSFTGSKLFSYGIGSGPNDPVLGFPVRYSSIDNVGDISFDVAFNSDTFTYVSGNSPVTQKVNTGYVHDYTNRDTFIRDLGWQTSVAQSVQYQVFSFRYVPDGSETVKFECDVAALPKAEDEDGWSRVELFVNNDCQCASFYAYTTTENTTTVTYNRADRITEPTVIQVLVLSNQVSKNAYYSIPVNLSNNPFNEDLETVNVGDIRGHYRDIFVNAGLFGTVFGSNNFRDRGNLVPFGSKIIQNSASLVLPGTFLRKTQHSVFDAIRYNSDEYTKFKNLLIDTIDNIDFTQRFMPSSILDQAMDIITESKSENQSFFWSDMLPVKSPLVQNTYTFANNLSVSSYPLTTTYDFDKSNYNGVLVYLSRVINGITIERLLVRDEEYVVSADSPNVTITIELIPNDKITIKEYNQTYGSYVPNTPTKLGMYPSYKPRVILDDAYTQETYFILGHDGSYNKLYGSYDPVTGILEDFRDQGLLEFELRIYNNLKLGKNLAFDIHEFVPGYFRNTSYTNEEFTQIYSTFFLNWIGKNRLNYKTQVFNRTNEFTFNYTNSADKISKKPIQQGYWRGVYQYFYDTTTPDKTPWEMLGFTDQPSWWTDRYGPAPYTSDNLNLWTDLENGFIWNDGDSYTDELYARPQLTKVIPVDSSGNLVSPFTSIVGNYNPNTFQKDWKVGDMGPVELSYRRSSSYPFDLMKIVALMKPAKFFNLAVDLDNYRYSDEFNQYLVNNRSHLIIDQIDIYGNGVAKASYINWIVDFEKQLGIDATNQIETLLNNLDVRLVYRLAGYSDKDLLKFFVEKSTLNSNNASLLIPDESYSVLLYDNQPFDKITYSGVAIQKDKDGYTVFGNSQTNAYFSILKPLSNGSFRPLDVENVSVKVAKDYTSDIVYIPYGTKFYSEQEVAQFLTSYGAYLRTRGMAFDDIVNGIEINWDLMAGEFLYWSQIGWENGSIITVNPSADTLKIDRESSIVQPLTIRNQNFILNQNLYPIQSKDMSVFRDGTLFAVTALNQGDTVAYGQFNISNFEHGVVFDNKTLFDDAIYNLVTGLRQSRIYVDGTKTAEWNGTVNASGFILNQDNVQEWSKSVKYTKGSIVLYKNKYWTATKVIEASNLFDEQSWKETNYDDVQKGLLPNPSTRSYESVLYYDTNRANLEKDSDLLGFSLIGYRPRDYLALADLTDITQINVYKNLIKNKGTRNAIESFRGAELPRGGIDYEVYENWAIKASEYGGTLNKNFVDFKLNEAKLTGNPSIVSLTNGTYTEGSQQEVPLYSLFNYGQPVSEPNILKTIDPSTNDVFPSAGYVNFDDVKLSSYTYNDLSIATNQNDQPVSIRDFNVGDYAWIANYNEDWNVLSWKSVGQVIAVRSNINNTAVVTFSKPHGLRKDEPLSIINYSSNIDGYYTVLNVVSLTEVVINFIGILTNPTTGQGIGLTFVSNRVDTPSKMIDNDPTKNEFGENLVWIDESTNGDWAVYKKQSNFKYDIEFSRPVSETFGSQVVYTPTAGYIISDEANGEVYRYTRTSNGQYTIIETLTGGPSFGKSIVNAGNIFVISEPTGTPRVHVYELVATTLVNGFVLLETISAPGGVTDWGTNVSISGDSNWIYISDIDNTSVYVYRKQGSSYVQVAIIDGTEYGLTSTDGFGKSISTDYYGERVFIGAPDKDYSISIQKWGSLYAITRTVQNFEVQTSSSTQPSIFTLSWETEQHSSLTGTQVSGSYITASGSMTSFSVNDRVMFSGGTYGTSGIQPNKLYYIADISGSTFSIKNTPTSTAITLNDTVGLSFGIFVQIDPISIQINGKVVSESNYAVVDGSSLVYVSNLLAGDIIQVSGNKFTLAQVLTSSNTTRTGNQFGMSVDCNKYSSEVLVGSPFEVTPDNKEGVVYRWTDVGKKYGLIVGENECNITQERTVLINGYRIVLPIGNAQDAANTINSNSITNIQASAQDNKLIIQVVNKDLTIKNNKLTITSSDEDAITEMGLSVYTNTQNITSPYNDRNPTQFGYQVKFNEFDSVVISAPVSTRYNGTTFDDVTIFDNNATVFVDELSNAGSVYMFDYVENYDENITNTGKFVYAQSLNSKELEYGLQPFYGKSLYYGNNQVIIGTPGFRPDTTDGLVTVYINDTGIPSISLFRQSMPVVDVESIQNIQLFSAETNTTIANMDYIDPLRGKLLGSVRQNIDYVSSVDPAAYNIDEFIDNRSGMLWASQQVGKLWFDTSNVRFMNYHQNDVVYNSKWWGRVFPGSDVAIYTWIKSDVVPSDYNGPGVPRDINQYTESTTIDASNNIVPVYYFWARNTNIIFSQLDKTLSDTIIEQYIRNPRQSGIAYVAALLPNTFALYNSQEYINAQDTVFHIGYSSGSTDDMAHSEYNLIRQNYADDFLSGIPKSIGDLPSGLYDRLLDSMAGADEVGNVVPNPYLPKAVQSGILARPRQSMFIDRLSALKNYLTYANTVMSQFPIAEIKPDLGLLFTSGEFFDTKDYWEYTNWWAMGYDDTTKSSIQVSLYNDLLALSVAPGTIVTVEMNGEGKKEYYRYDDNKVWTRIGLEQGTIKFKVELWDYTVSRTGFGDNFFDSDVFDEWPSEETRYIIRALTEQIYTNELAMFRNRSLILLFEYIQSESSESQNYLPWLNKTSLVDVEHTIRELVPLEIFQTDNQEFLEGYINEVKPYRVVIKDFMFKYTGQEVYNTSVSDFDLPAQYNANIQKFVSPELVYSNANDQTTYLPGDDIWQTPAYADWFANRGIKLTGQKNCEISTLAVYVQDDDTEIFVDNVQGFPINGVITINNEKIAYSVVDRVTSSLSGLTRGYDNTEVQTHIPGSQIYMDLPPVMVFNGGRGYSFIPRVSAYIDSEKYPAPIREAVLEPIMGLDSVLDIRVIDPGEGYAVLPEIRIEPANILTFTNNDIDSLLHTISLFAPNLQTGDLARFNKGNISVGVNNLQDNQWYYVRVLETSPTAVISLYTNIVDAFSDKNRVEISDIGENDQLTLSVGAKATAITQASPIRENNIRLRFDRTSYTSQIQDWKEGVYYGSYFAGSYNNLSSGSSVRLQSTLPSIDSITSSLGGVAFEITDVSNNRILEWSSFERNVVQTVSTGNKVRLGVLVTGAVEENASGSTIGFYVGMPIKFTGSVVGGIIEDQTYYVESIINDTDFTISTEQFGSQVSLTSATVPLSGLKCITGELSDTAKITVNYPGIRKVTNTIAEKNLLTIPLNSTGTGGTFGLYTGLPVFFTGNVFENIIENEIYYVTTVINNKQFIISETDNPVMITVISSDGITETVELETVEGLSVNDPVIFTDMIVSDNDVTVFGNIVSGEKYYVYSVDTNNNTIQLTTQINGLVFNPGTVTADTNTSATVTNQKNTVDMETASGSMTINIGFPVSPGQVDGQLFTLYNTSIQYPNLTGVNGNIIERSLSATITGVDRIAIKFEDYDDTDNLYINMPIQFVNVPVGSGLSAGTTYYIIEYTDGDTVSPIEIEVTNTSSSGNILTCDTTASLYPDMPIIFSGDALGGIEIGDQYFVETIINSTQITIKDVLGNQIVLTTDNGIMVGTGDKYIKVSTTMGGSAVTIDATIVPNPANGFAFEQEILNDAEFDVSYILGGYQALVSVTGDGYAIDNTILITGDQIGGTTPTNDLTLTVNTIDDEGKIIDVICSGNVPGINSKYYLKVTGDDTFEVYSDPLLKIPVSRIDFEFSGITTNTVTSSSDITDIMTLTDADDFEINDKVVFTGNTETYGLIEGKTYYIVAKSGNEIQISELPGETAKALLTSSETITITKSGSFALLPEPFYFNQSLVRYNNRVYECIVSNNDDTFIIGKWQELRSDDRRMNAMDRVIGYYQPTANMPGVDLTQVFEGTTYPNSVYYGNPFEPDEQFTLDVLLQSKEFTSTEPDTSIITGGEFMFGYSPEELVAGIVTDSLAMKVTTRPGTNWLVEEYSHSGYNVVSKEIIPESETQVVYSFDNVVQYPSEIYVAVINGVTDLSVALYENVDYTIDWINNTITLNTPITFSPVSNRLRIDVYEVGNGDQLVKSNTKTDPIRLNDETGFNEIELNCNYSASITSGSGIIQQNTNSFSVFVTETLSSGNRIKCDSVENIVINSPVKFAGTVFGGIVENQTYFVKSISSVTNTITISETEISGIAGPIFTLSDATGTMLLNISVGSGLVWTPPLVHHNGDKLVLGISGIVVRTSSIDNSITTATTDGMIVGTPITFCSCSLPGSNIDPLTTYYVDSIINSTKFTISETEGGSTKILTDATGRSLFITNDFAIAIADNNISAKIIFANQYNNSVDYLVYSLFGQTFPAQYGYTLPETEQFISLGSPTFTLSNYVGDDNITNSIVEVNGLRIAPSEYVIDDNTDTITFNVAPTIGDIISVTTFNDTQRQFFDTQEIVATQNEVVSSISNISNAITLPLAVTAATSSSAITNEITVISTTGFVVNQTVQFKGTSFDANILTDGTIYFVEQVIDATTFSIKDKDGVSVVLAGGSGVMEVIVGGAPSVRITTVTNHGLSENDIIRIAGTTGSIQLNNNQYYAKIIDDTRFDLYETAYDPASGAINSPITNISSYTGNGYVWLSGTYVLDNSSGFFNTNPDRVWVTVNGYRVPSSKLIMNASNELSILTDISINDVIVITSMVPYASPDEEVYMNFVDKNGVQSIYRAGTQTRTWLTYTLYELSNEIQVDDVTKLTNVIEEENVLSSPVSNIFSIGVSADKNIITGVSVFNNTTNSVIPEEDYEIVIENLSPILKLADTNASSGDSITITILEGNTVYINGEQIRFGKADFINNKLINIQRGVNGTGKQFTHDKYSEVYGLLSKNRLNDVNYNLTWNSTNFSIDGDPLQISDTVAARFLTRDIL